MFPLIIDCPVDYAENTKLTAHLKELMENCKSILNSITEKRMPGFQHCFFCAMINGYVQK